MNTQQSAESMNSAQELAKLPAYVNFSGPLPTSLLLQLAIEDPCHDVKMSYEMGKTWHSSGKTYSTKWSMISGNEDLDTVRDEDEN